MVDPLEIPMLPSPIENAISHLFHLHQLLLELDAWWIDEGDGHLFSEAVIIQWLVRLEAAGEVMGLLSGNMGPALLELAPADGLPQLLHEVIGGFYTR